MPTAVCRLIRFLYPDRTRLDLISNRSSLIGTATAFEPADQSDGHVVLTLDLTAEPNAGIIDLARLKRLFFSVGHA